MYDAGCHEPCCSVPKMRQQKERRLRALKGPLKVPALGGVRRIDSLRAGGWPVEKIAAELGVSHHAVDRMRRRAHCTMYVTTAKKLDHLFETLGATPGPSEATRRRALSQGHRPPMDWYGLDIDDPKQKPAKEPQGRGIDLDEWHFLVRGGESPERAAERCGVTIGAVERAAHRAGRLDLASIAAAVRNHQRAEAT
jgi:hypothetical protein